MEIGKTNLDDKIYVTVRHRSTQQMDMFLGYGYKGQKAVCRIHLWCYWPIDEEQKRRANQAQASF